MLSTVTIVMLSTLTIIKAGVNVKHGMYPEIKHFASILFVPRVLQTLRGAARLAVADWSGCACACVWDECVCVCVCESVLRLCNSIIQLVLLVRT